MITEFATETLLSAHSHCTGNNSQLIENELCGCFYCLATYSPGEINEWIIEKDKRETAICPKCDTDSVIGSKSEYPVSNKIFFKKDV